MGSADHTHIIFDYLLLGINIGRSIIMFGSKNFKLNFLITGYVTGMMHDVSQLTIYFQYLIDFIIISAER